MTDRYYFRKQMRNFERDDANLKRLAETEYARATGRSTVLIMKFISEAMSNPGQDILLEDHYPSREATRHLAYALMDIVTKLGFQGFEFKLNNLSIKYTPPRLGIEHFEHLRRKPE